MKFERMSGVFLHPTSLAGRYGIGSLGAEAYQFIDFLAGAGQKLWQICPLGPTGYGDSPYQCFSAFAGNPMLISLERLVEEGLLSEGDLAVEIEFDKDIVEYGKVIDFKMPLLKKAFNKFSSIGEKTAFRAFCEQNAEWLDDYALFRAVKSTFNERPWNEWDEDIKLREEAAVAKYKEELAEEIEFRSFIQYLFFKQWTDVREYANQKGIKIVGDIPIFVAMDSADAWANPEVFYFDEDMKPTKVAGVPPDYFSETGQLWGNPLYNWDKLRESNYQWWVKRIEALLEVADIVRIDHFRGFAAYWAVPYGEKTAINGEWEKAPGMELFKTIKDELGELPIIVEDLGLITEDVEKLKKTFDFPGMEILQFAFDGEEDNNVTPERYTTDNCVVYTGTHDNNTTLGWYTEDASKADQKRLEKYLDKHLDYRHDSIVWDLIELAWSSRAVIALVTLQDVLELGSEARFNIPGVLGGNWDWKYRSEMLTEERMLDLKEMTERNDR
ncbi:4-alpha-glucanotransferase [Orenia metallireducens]|jgi:4-alpha-glucanotransferase|uniref:4-alpha-glucanotransferase n=1 Tax=Orenia metallireducens TaxID=1413210 RepID=A0A285HPB8_9FIRM|nr:4-alpha-glucanotransferase [Orenia metallireducens]PRX27986.1 4-alpha-glucanotransferase [Orenia metallireducens]SNY37433.1 4-alpha-glucanotransferase [Orenia metallireducens]